MKYVQPQFQSLVHRLRALLPKARLERQAPHQAEPKQRWEQLELELQGSSGVTQRAANAAHSTKPVRPVAIRAATRRRG